MKSVLVACPTYDGKDYALEEYLNAYNAFTYPQKHLFLVDNSASNYLEKLKGHGIECEHLVPSGKKIDEVLVESWKTIVKKAVEEKYDYLFCCEADNINPSETISYLVELADRYNFSVVAHDYPEKSNVQFPDDRILGLGCTLIKVDIFGNGEIAGNLFDFITQKGLSIIQIRNVLNTKHLGENNG